MIRSRHRTEDGGGRQSRRRLPLLCESLEPRRLLSTFVVDNTSDSGAGSLRAAITAANADPSPGTDNIYFNIPASTAPGLNVPVPGFDPTTQDWTITLASPLPTITRPVAIDGYTQAHAGNPIPYHLSRLDQLGRPNAVATWKPDGGNIHALDSCVPVAGRHDCGDSLHGRCPVPSRICPDGDYRCRQVAVTGGPLPNSSLTDHI